MVFENPLREIASTAQLRSDNAIYGERYIEASYDYHYIEAEQGGNDKLSGCPIIKAVTKKRSLKFRTDRRLPRVGVMLAGLGGNNGTTFVAGTLANRHKLSWRTRTHVQNANWYGSLCLSSTSKIGVCKETGIPVSVSLNTLLPMLSPDSLMISGWDINGTTLGDAMRRSAVLDIQLQDLLFEEMQKIRPLPAVYISDYIAANQEERANNILRGSLQEQLEIIRGNIRDFRHDNNLDKVIVLWTATTERFTDIIAGVHDTKENLLKAIAQNYSEISPSTIYAVAAVLEGCSYINGSPQNTCVPAVVDLAEQYGVFLAGDDFKSGQTKLKSVLVDFLISAGIKPTSIVSYNHLGNNDGMNLSAPLQFRSKEISKSTVVDDMVESNPLLYKAGETPDHCVVIKYVPYVGDSKRAMDEYTSEIFLGGTNTIVIHNTCEDSLLAAPIILDLIMLTELCERISIYDSTSGTWEKFHTILSLLGYLCKAPLHPEGTPVVNALFSQRGSIINVLRACIGLCPEHHMDLEYRIPSMMLTVNPTYYATHHNQQSTTASRSSVSLCNESIEKDRVEDQSTECSDR